MTTIDTFRRTFIAGGLALAALTAGCAVLAPSPVPTTWTSVTHLVSMDQASGRFKREGVALFPKGEAALMTIDGQFLARDASTFTARVAYRFEDGSTFVHEGTGKGQMVNGLLRSTGEGRFTSGSGRFAGISGGTTSTSRSLSATEQVGEFRAEGSLTGK